MSLKQLFQESGYGSNAALFEAYFVKDSRPPRCAACGNSIHLHTSDSREEREPTHPESDQQICEQPEQTVNELQNYIALRAIDQSKTYPSPFPMPPHWRDSAFRVFSYYTFKKTEVLFRHGQSPVVKAVWQCAAGSEGHPCEHTIKTDGLRDTLSSHLKTGTQCFKAATKPSFKILEPTEAEVSSLAEHLRLAHGINVNGVVESGSGRGRWGSSLFGCLDHPNSCLDCLLCYPCGMSCWCLSIEAFVGEECMVLRLNRLTNHTSQQCVPCLFCQPYQPRTGFVVYGHDPFQCLSDVFAYPLLGFLLVPAIWIATTPLVFVTQLFTSLFTF